MRDTTARAPRTLAQWYCLIFGVTLLLAGIFGFIADTSFDTSTSPEGSSFLGLEVNGWHNLVHLGSGLLLLAAANTRPTAKTVAIGFGFVYAIVALWGLIDGQSVLFIPVNGADNILHAAIAVLGVVLGMRSPTTKREQIRGRRRTADRAVRRDAAAGTQTEIEPEAGSSSDNGITRTRS